MVHPADLHRDRLLRRHALRDEPRGGLAADHRRGCRGRHGRHGCGAEPRLRRRSSCRAGTSGTANTDTTDVVYHGTYTASLIAAQPNNGLGIVGVAPGAMLMPVKVLGPNEEWDNTKILAGLNYAVNTPGVRAVNISLAGSELADAGHPGRDAERGEQERPARVRGRKLGCRPRQPRVRARASTAPASTTS